MGFGRKADHQSGPVFVEMGNRLQDVRVFRQGKAGELALVQFQLLVRRFGRSPVRHGGHGDEDIRRQGLFDRRQHFQRGLHMHRLQPVRIGQGRRAGDQGDLRAQGGTGLCDRITLLAGRMVGDEADRIDRLTRRSRRDQDMASFERVSHGSGLQSHRQSRPVRPCVRGRIRHRPSRPHPARQNAHHRP